MSYNTKDLIDSFFNIFKKSKIRQPHTQRSFFEKMSGGLKNSEIDLFFKSMSNYDRKINLLKFCKNCFLIYKKE